MQKTTLIISLFILILSSSCDSKSTKEKASNSMQQADSLTTDSSGLSKAEVTIKTVHGNIVFKLYPKHAPITVTRFIELIQNGFYDGLSFHRVVSNFVIQGGDPTATGTGGSGKKLPAEFNSIQHIRGTVAMARANDINSADSQFYIALTTLPHLDGKFTVFGQVTDGLDILDKISQGDKMLTVSINLN